MAPPALFKNFGKASSDLFKDDNWSATHKLEISNKNSQQALNASVDAAGKSEISIKFAPSKDVASTFKIEEEKGKDGSMTLENAYSLKAQGIKLTLNASQPTAGSGSTTFKAGGEYSHELVTLAASHDTKMDKSGKTKTEVALTTGAASCNFWAGLKTVLAGGLSKADSQVMVAYTGPLHVTATSSLDLTKKEISVFSQVNSNFSAACNFSSSAKDGNVAKVGFINTVNSDSSYRAIVSSAGDVALNYKQKLTASTTLCLGTKLGLANIGTPAAITAGISISL